MASRGQSIAPCARKPPPRKSCFRKSCTHPRRRTGGGRCRRFRALRAGTRRTHRLSSAHVHECHRAWDRDGASRRGCLDRRHHRRAGKGSRLRTAGPQQLRASRTADARAGITRPASPTRKSNREISSGLARCERVAVARQAFAPLQRRRTLAEQCPVSEPRLTASSYPQSASCRSNSSHRCPA